MSQQNLFQPNPKLDLVLERVIDVPRESVWAAWTQPELLKKWYAPKPWATVACEIDLRPGGLFRTVMRSPEGQEFPADGCYLEVVQNERLVFTDAFLPGYRPSPQPFMTGRITLAAHGTGTKYTAIAMHKDEETRNKHDEMGFHQGWSQALDQLVAMIKSESR